MPEDIMLRICRRILRNAKQDKGMHLSADEVACLADQHVIFQAVYTADEDADDERERTKP